MGHYNYLIVTLVNLNTKKQWEFKVLNASVDLIYGENFDQKLADRWTKFLEGIELDYGILQNDGDDEKIVLSSDELDNSDCAKLIRILSRFWIRAGYKISDLTDNDT